MFIRKTFYAGIFILWFTTMAVLVSRHYSLDKDMQFAAYKSDITEELYKEQWMGIYYKGEKIGYSARKTEQLNGGYKVLETINMRLNIMQTPKEIETITEAYLDSDMRLNSFSFTLKADADMNINGRVEGRTLKLLLEAFGVKSEQTIPLKDEPFLSLSLIPSILNKGIVLKKRFSMMIFDPATLNQESMNIEVAGREQIMAMGIKQEAFKLKSEFKGIEFFVWITEKGKVLREETPLGFILIAEDKETARQVGKTSVDIIAQVAAPFNIKLPPDVGYLKIRISGIDFKGLDLDGGRQSLRGDVLEIRKEEVSSSKLKGKSLKAPDEYLKETMFIQSKDHVVVSLSKAVVKNEKDKLKSARLIYEWIYKNIEKVPTITIPMATEVLKTKRGDCNEHTTLFTALARAAGIPTRIALGLIYKDGFFYYHAWPEIFAGRWIAVDPTAGQFPADAAHIRLITGDIDKQAQILSVIGKIKIEGLEHR